MGENNPYDQWEEACWKARQDDLPLDALEVADD